MNLFEAVSERRINGILEEANGEPSEQELEEILRKGAEVCRGYAKDLLPAFAAPACA